MVHERRVAETGEELTFKVSGQVRLGNLILYDQKTGTTWLQETGRALEGPQKGRTLKVLDDEAWAPRIRWEAWRKAHPKTLVWVCVHCNPAWEKVAKRGPGG